MLCMQQCIDQCDLAPEEAEAIRDHATVAEILAIQAECPYAEAAAKGVAADPEAVAVCGMLDIRDRLPEEVWAADDYDDLESVVGDCSAYEETRDRDGADAG